MKTEFSRRSSLLRMGGAIAGLLTLSAARAAKAAVQKVLVSTTAPNGYDDRLRPTPANNGAFTAGTGTVAR